MKKTRMGGFTLIELLVVVLIIGILASVALPQYQKAVIKSRTVETKTMLANLEKGMQLYLLENDNVTNQSVIADLALGNDLGGMSCSVGMCSKGDWFMWARIINTTTPEWYIYVGDDSSNDSGRRVSLGINNAGRWGSCQYTTATNENKIFCDEMLPWLESKGYRSSSGSGLTSSYH